MSFESEYTVSPRIKDTGAYYTSHKVAEFLVRWSIRSSRDTVLDPSFGGGVFLFEASKRIEQLGGVPADQVLGIELDSASHTTVTNTLFRDFAISAESLCLRDFFDYEPLPVNQVSVVVGNPPFIRYQRFGEEFRERALGRASEQGVKLSRLCSSWAPFVVHCVSMIKRRGRLAMVLPAELGHAKYATPVLEFFARSFGKVTLLTFKKKLFPDLSEDTLLLLAEDKGSSTSRILHRDFRFDASLEKVRFVRDYAVNRTQAVPVEPLVNRSRRLIEHLLPKKTRELYFELKTLARVKRLGALVDVGIGYVTGANDFFHLSPAQAQQWKIPEEFLKAAVRNGRAFQGLQFNKRDWTIAAQSGDSGFLLSIPRTAELPQSLLAYLDVGDRKGVPNAYKCRVREPWYSVPGVLEPDAFLTYMSTGFPKFVTNQAGAVAPNTLHVARVKPNVAVSASDIAVLWRTSLSALSVEVEGHSLGGGMLKLEPTEAANCLLPTPAISNGGIESLCSEMNALIRSGQEEKAKALGDVQILRNSLGLSALDIRLLAEGAALLMDRRISRGSK